MCITIETLIHISSVSIRRAYLIYEGFGFFRLCCSTLTYHIRPTMMHMIINHFQGFSRLSEYLRHALYVSDIPPKKQ